VVGVSGNGFKIEIDLPVDRFHFKDDRHMAETVRLRVAEFLNGPGGRDGCYVRVVPVTGVSE
jgi:hypothetical protein